MNESASIATYPLTCAGMSNFITSTFKFLLAYIIASFYDIEEGEQPDS